MKTGKAKKDKAYLVCARDGMYLAAIRDSGIEEFIDGKLVKVPTGLYSADRRDAIVYEKRERAGVVAGRVGGKVLAVEGRIDRHEEGESDTEGGVCESGGLPPAAEAHGGTDRPAEANALRPGFTRGFGWRVEGPRADNFARGKVTF